MLDDFKVNQKVVYQMLKNAGAKRQFSHAYLIDANHYPRKLEFAMALAKFILCENHYSNSDNCVNCTQCKRIDDGNFTELKIIEPDGAWIKKEQIDELQKDFSTKSVESKQKVYIIHSAEKMNASASNSILKFLEEPEDNIIAILLTDNIYQLLNTIISRCQIISFQDFPNFKEHSTLEIIANMIKNTNEEIEEFKNDEKNIDKLDAVVRFVQQYETDHKKILLNIKNIWFNTFNDREGMLEGLDLLILLYKDILNISLSLPMDIFHDYENHLVSLSHMLTPVDICYRLDVIIEYKNYLKVNANINLLMDKLIIELERRR